MFTMQCKFWGRGILLHLKFESFVLQCLLFYIFMGYHNLVVYVEFINFIPVICRKY